MPRRRSDAGHENQHLHNLDDLHEACSSGEGFNCGKCTCDWVELAREHNRGITMQKIKDGLPGAPATVEPAKAPSGSKSEPAI